MRVLQVPYVHNAVKNIFFARCFKLLNKTEDAQHITLIIDTIQTTAA